MIVLKPGKEKPILGRHPWIFSGAIASSPKKMDGELYPVFSSKQEKLGHGYFNSRSNLTGRMVSFGDEDPVLAIQRHLQNALSKRKEWFGSETNAYRLVNGEGDFLPGLIVDRYNDTDVMQISTLGMEKLKPAILPFFDKVYEKSLSPSRKEEGLKPFQGWIKGSGDEKIRIQEHAMHYLVDIAEGQKTGFFLDQREMRRKIKELSKGKRVLNAFSYTGGFTISALSGGAAYATSIDISRSAVEMVDKNIELNHFPAQKSIEGDVFEFLRSDPLDFDIIILDPPAFAKKQKDIIAACRGYKDINRLAIAKMPANSLLLTCSCSYYVDEALFRKVLFQAAAEAKRDVQIIARHELAKDHPVNIFHPESDYLKSFLLLIN